MDLSERPDRPKPAGWDGDRHDRPLVLYALVPAWGPVEEPTATVAAADLGAGVKSATPALHSG